MKSDRIAFQLIARGLNLRLRSSGPDHEGWCFADAEILAEPFSGTMHFQMLFTDWKGLLKTLQELDRNVGKQFESSWRDCEGNIQLTFSLNFLGRIAGYYRFADREGADLSGQFRADQSYLGGWIQQLKT